MDTPSSYVISLTELEHSARVASEDQVEEVPSDHHHDVIAPEDLARQRLLGISGPMG